MINVLKLIYILLLTKIDCKSVTFTINLCKLMTAYFPHQIILVTDFKIDSILKFKDAIPSFSAPQSFINLVEYKQIVRLCTMVVPYIKE